MRDVHVSDIWKDSDWHHVIFTYDDSATPKSKLYFDGVYVPLNNLGGNGLLASNDLPLVLGYCQVWGADPHNPWIGDLDEVRLYNRALSAGEAAALYEQCGDQLCPYVTKVGFSDDPYGEQDVTEFLNDEALYVYVRDVDLDPTDPKCRIQVRVDQKKKWGAAGKKVKVTIYLDPQPDGSFRGAIPLNAFSVGAVRVKVKSHCPDAKVYREGFIYINPPPP
jgi:hypothetical protein